MFPKSVFKIAVLSTALFGLAACGMFSSNDKANHDKQSNTVATKPKADPNATIIAKRRGTNELEIHVGGTESKKTATEQRVKAGDVQYYTNGIVLKREDIQNAFVAKTIADEPALALRLKPDSATKLANARKGYSHILASINGNIVSTVEGTNGNLMDGVLLMPMPTLVSARDAADLIR